MNSRSVSRAKSLQPEEGMPIHTYTLGRLRDYRDQVAQDARDDKRQEKGN